MHKPDNLDTKSFLMMIQEILDIEIPAYDDALETANLIRIDAIDSLFMLRPYSTQYKIEDTQDSILLYYSKSVGNYNARVYLYIKESDVATVEIYRSDSDVRKHESVPLKAAQLIAFCEIEKLAQLP
jgi:chromosome condensin MukBEF MukE localization factor